MRSYRFFFISTFLRRLIGEISSLTERIGNFTGRLRRVPSQHVRMIRSPQRLDSGLRIRKEMSSTLYITLPRAAGVAKALPARTVWKAVAKRGSTEGGATGMLWAPRTTFTCGARAASRRIEAL